MVIDFCSVRAMSSKNAKPWVCALCRAKNPAEESVCQGCDASKSIARKPREKTNPYRDADREPWASFDADGDGVIAPHEFERLYSLLRKPYFGDASSVFKFFDDDGNGFIDYDEFYRNIKNPSPAKTEYPNIVFIKDAISMLNGDRGGDDYFDAAELKKAAAQAIPDQTELLQFVQYVDRRTLKNGKIDVDDFVAKLGYA